MSEADQYRANMTVCRQMADKAPNEQDKRAWLDLAESWRLLVIARDEGIAREDLTGASYGQRIDLFSALSEGSWKEALVGLFSGLTRGLVRPVEARVPILSEIFPQLAKHAEVSSRIPGLTHRVEHSARRYRSQHLTSSDRGRSWHSQRVNRNRTLFGSISTAVSRLRGHV